MPGFFSWGFYGRLGHIMRRFACFLALVSGLVFTSPLFAAATVSANEGAAAVACSAVVSVQTGVSSKCVSKSLTPYTFGGSTYYGAYFCINLRGSGTSWAVRYCSADGSAGSAISTFSGSNAQAQAQAYYDSNVPPASITSVSQVYSSNRSAFFVWTTLSPDCSSASSFLSTTLMADTPNGSGNACHNGCQYSVAVGYVGTYPSGYLEFDFAPTGSACSPSDSDSVDVNEGPEDISQDKDGDGVNDDDDTCPNDPTDTCNIPDDSKDSDGDGIPDYRDTHPNDATNGKDDGSGNETDNESSGGADCVTPPSCSGDAIQCNILYQSWAGRCGHTGTSGQTGGGNPGGDGDGTDLTPLTDRWDSTFGDGSFTGDNTSSIPGLSDRVSDLTIDSDSLDTSGLGLSRSCPAVLTTGVSFSFFGHSYQLDFDMFCDLLELVGTLLVVFSSFLAVRVLLGKN